MRIFVHLMMWIYMYLGREGDAETACMSVSLTRTFVPLTGSCHTHTHTRSVCMCAYSIARVSRAKKRGVVPAYTYTSRTRTSETFAILGIIMITALTISQDFFSMGSDFSSWISLCTLMIMYGLARVTECDIDDNVRLSTCDRV